MTEITRLIEEVQAARESYLRTVRGFNPEQARYTPAADVWSAVEITEHLVRAEYGGICWMWKAVEGFDRGEPVWRGEATHRGKSIEQVVAETWEEKEVVPPVAAPTWGGSLAFWIAALEANGPLLVALGRALDGHDLEEIHFPHPISGPLDMRQRLEFLRFHLVRHRGQLERLVERPDFPGLEMRQFAAD